MRIFFLFLFLILSPGLFAQDLSCQLMQESPDATVLRFMVLGTGALIAVESTLLMIGMNLPQPTSWSHPFNIVFGVSDVLLGCGLVALTLFHPDVENSPLFYLFSSVLIISHAWREGQYFSSADPFAANVPLFVFNNIRLGLLIGAGGLGLAVRF